MSSEAHDRVATSVDACTSDMGTTKPANKLLFIDEIQEASSLSVLDFILFRVVIVLSCTADWSDRIGSLSFIGKGVTRLPAGNSRDVFSHNIKELFIIERRTNILIT